MSEEPVFQPELVEGAETPTIMIIGDAPEESARARRVLERYCFRVILAASSQAALEVLGREAVVGIIADERVEGASGLDFLRRAMAVDPKPRRLFIGTPDAGLLAAAINQGWLFACLPRPFDSRSLSQTAVRASEAYAQREEQRRLIEELTSRVQALEDEVRSLSQRPSRLLGNEPQVASAEYRFSGAEMFESARAIPIPVFNTPPPKPFQSAMPAIVENITERELSVVPPEERHPPGEAPNFQEHTQRAVTRLISGLSAGAPPEETAWGLAALVVLGQDAAAGSAARRAAARLMGLAGSGRGGSIAAWALSERYSRTQNPSDRDLAEAALAWVSLPSTTTPDLAAVSSLLALVAGAEAGLGEEMGAAERLRSVAGRIMPTTSLSNNNALMMNCLAALAGKEMDSVAMLLAVTQRTSGALAGEVDLPNMPPLISTAMAAIIFGVAQLQGAVVRVLRGTH